MLVLPAQPFENYILNILVNFKQLPLERLHSLLRVFVVSGAAGVHTRNGGRGSGSTHVTAHSLP